MTPASADALLDRVQRGHGLTSAEGAELVAYVHGLRQDPSARLVGLVGDIREQVARSSERSDQAHEKAAEALARIEALTPTLQELAAAKAAEIRSATRARETAEARAERASARVLDFLTGAMGQRAAAAILTLLVGAVAAALGIEWTR